MAPLDPEFKALWKDASVAPLGTDVTATRAQLAAIEYALAGEEPAPGVIEENINITARDGYQLPISIHRPAIIPSEGSPLIVLYHGGAFCVGSPQGMAGDCRAFVQQFSAICVNVDYRLAPEHPFPIGVQDAWDALQWTAANVTTSPYLRGAAPHTKGFLIAGESAGGNFAAVVAHLAQDSKLDPPLTGQYLRIPTVLLPEAVPEKHKAEYLSHKENVDAPLLSGADIAAVYGLYKPDIESELVVPFNHPTGHGGIPKTYFQVCELDPLRDESLIYERVLREDWGVKTKLDFYPGLPHGFWFVFPQLSASIKAKEDAMAGVAWLLEQDQ